MSGFFDWFPWWRPAPAPPDGAVSFTFTGGNPMDLTINVSLQPADPIVTKRTVTITINGGTPLVLDAAAGHVSAPCKANDQVNVSAVDTSAGGKASQAATWSGIAVDTVTVPATPVFAVSFTPATPAAA